MRYLLSFLLVITIVCPAASQVTNIEYFADTDPGYGNATQLTVSAGADISNIYNLALASYPSGFHIVSFRGRDAQGHWGHTFSYSFYILADPASSVSASEYYIDTDPGYGNAMPVSASVAADSSLKFIVPLTTYATGFHSLGIRSKDNQNKWSQTLRYAFYVNGNSSAVNITALQYYFVAEGIVYDSMVIAVTPAATVNLDFKTDLSKLTGNKIYDMHIWAINADGARSEVLIKKVKVCSDEVAKSKFDVVPDGYNVSFINNSTAGAKYLWDFGNGSVDSVNASPLFKYTVLGNYNVRLITSNFCNSDTTTKIVSVSGIKSIYANHGGNTGKLTVNIKGAGFVPGMQVYLHQNSQPDILGDTVAIQDIGSLTTSFDLTGKAKGLWDVISIFPNGTKDTLPNGFTIETGADPKLWVDINGPSILRIGFKQVYTITCGNTGNTDATFVPILISGLPLGTNIQIQGSVFNVNSLPQFQNLNFSKDGFKNTVDDSASNSSERLIYLPIVPGNSSVPIPVIFIIPQTTPLHTTPKIKVTAGAPELDWAKIGDCAESLITIAGGEILDRIKGHNPVVQWTKCISGIGTVLEDAAHEYVRVEGKKPAESRDILDGGDLLASTLQTGIDCGEAGWGSAFPEFDLAYHIVSVAAKVFSGGEAFVNCRDALKNVAEVYFTPVVGNASDPNAKYGIGDASDSHFTNDNPPLAYTINFENTPGSLLNAQSVSVLDTLNQSFFDYSSFGFTSVTLGDSVYTLPAPAKSFVHDFDFTSLYGVRARVTASFDTLSGVAQWSFLSIDPATNQATRDALAGFLPPDITSPKGQGYVSYVVRQNKNILTGDTVSNTASIKFDYNPVLATNAWTNVFDLIKPNSSVQSLPAETADTTFRVHWQGADNASGIRSYNVFFAVNDGPFQLWLSNAFVADSNFTGKTDSTYRFYSIATDNAGNIEDPKTTGETFTHITSSVALPINLVNFTARLADKNGLLNWVTSSEQNSRQFIIQRSVDAVNFSNIAAIAAAGFSTVPLNYKYTDSNITTLNLVKVYYRLQIVDKDGKYKYSPAIQLILHNTAFTAQVLPNPVINDINLSVINNREQTFKVSVTDVSGKIILMDAGKLIQGSNLFHYSTAGWQAGIYIMRLMTKDGTLKTFKIVKQ